jgi:pentatricopeptide repeat protein
MKLFASMVDSVVQPNNVTYNTLLYGYFKNGRIEDALTLFREMFSKGVIPDGITYSIILQRLFEAGRTSDAKELYQMMVDNGIQLKIDTYNTSWRTL